MAKFIISQTTKSGKNIVNAGDNQRIVFNQNGSGSDDGDMPDMPPMPGAGRQDNIRSVGRNAKIFVNGKRVQ